MSIWNPNMKSTISLRDEVTSLFRGGQGDVPVGKLGIFRRLQRDSNGQPILCNCRDLGTKSKKNMHVCDQCLNEGYKWVEEWIYYHKKSGIHGSRQIHNMEITKEMGSIYMPKDVFYLEYSVLPTILDSIIEVTLDIEGNVVTPVTRKSFHNIRAVEEFRADNGRIEFFQCSCEQLTVGFFGQPLRLRIPASGRLP